MSTWLRATVLLAVLVAAASTSCRASSQPSPARTICGHARDPITSGPRLGAVTESNVKVWVGSCTQAKISVQYKPSAADWKDARETATVTTGASTDHTAVVPVTSLQAGTRYDYRMLVDRHQLSRNLGGSFTTLPLPGRGSAFSFIISSDMHHPNPPLPDAMLNVMAQRHVQFALLGGDQIEIEHVLFFLGRCCFPESQADYEKACRDMFAYQPFANFVASTPTMLMWDDHEIINDWSKGNAYPYPWARAAFNEYAASANPAPRAPGG